MFYVGMFSWFDSYLSYKSKEIVVFVYLFEGSVLVEGNIFGFDVWFLVEFIIFVGS